MSKKKIEANNFLNEIIPKSPAKKNLSENSNSIQFIIPCSPLPISSFFFLFVGGKTWTYKSDPLIIDPLGDSIYNFETVPFPTSVV
jgi:hypothetical protein